MGPQERRIAYRAGWGGHGMIEQKRRPTDADGTQDGTPAQAGGGAQRFSFDRLAFTEILMSHQGSQLQVRRLERGRSVLGPADPEGQHSFVALRDRVQEAFGKPPEPGTTTRFVSHEGVRLKIVPVLTTTGEIWVARKVRQTPPLGQIEGIPQAVRTHLSNLGRQGQSGILVVSGQPNSGKTTMSLSIVMQWAKTWGEIAVVAEDLPEVRLDGVIKDSQGRIAQVRLERDPAAYDEFLRGLLSLSPRFAEVGGVSSEVEARLALDLAMAGVLVVTTVNAADELGAISNLINRATITMGAEAARDAVAMVLRGVMHQSLGDKDASADPTMRAVRLTSLFLPGPTGTQAMSRKIKEDKVQSLRPDVAAQENRIRNNQPPLDDGDRTQQR